MLVDIDKADKEEIVEITSNMNTRRRINGGKPTLQLIQLVEDNNAVWLSEVKQ